jgi:methylated-DNA-[protein]-cysteine S-methyltransferase
MKELDEYFLQIRISFNTPLKITGSHFQIKNWQNLQQIPYGETKSYKELAKLCNTPNASRAVGTAVRQNHFPIFIPCHRIIKSNGEAGEYSGGKEFKKNLLELERNYCK